MRPRLILAVVLLIVAPTGVLSLLAWWHVREREQWVDARIQIVAQNAVRSVVRQVRQKLDDNLTDLRVAVEHVLDAGGGTSQIATAAGRLRETHPLVTDVYVFMNPWGFIYPPERMPSATEAKRPDPGQPDALAQALGACIGTAGKWDETLGFQVANHGFCFVRVEERRSLYVGYRANPGELQRIVRMALLDSSGGGITLTAHGPGLAGGAGDGVTVSDSLSGTTRAVDEDVDRAPDRSSGSVRLAVARLHPPLDAVVVSATATSVGALREAEQVRTHLLRWGIALLGVSILAGLWVALREVAAEVRQARARSDFVVGVSHDLRTPVAAMKMLAESLLAGRVSSVEREKQFLGTIVQECDRLNQLVERVLFFVRYGQNALAFRRRPVDAVTLVRESVDAFAARVGGEIEEFDGGALGSGFRILGAALSEDPSGPRGQRSEVGGHGISGTSNPEPRALNPESPTPNAEPALPILADPAAMTQVILNLLDNAWKYSRGVPSPRPVEVRYSVISDRCSGFGGRQFGVRPPASPPVTLPWRHSRRWVCIAVTDHGIGISPGDRRRLFRQFHRGAAALNANVSGVGLGLAMCRHIVRRHGGRIDVRSEEGKGSTFTVWLPAWTESER
jgi:signal transduction histidine kinase